MSVGAPTRPATTGDALGRQGHRAWVGRLAVAMSFALLLGGALLAGLTVADATRSLVAIGVLQVVPGAVLWRAARRTTTSWPEDLFAGFAIGAGTSAAGIGVAGAVGVPAVGPFLPAALAVIVVLSSVEARARTRRPASPLTDHWGWGVGTALAHVPLLPVAHQFYVRTPIAWQGFRDTYPDMTFHHALAGQLANRGPDAMPHVLGQPLDYHWLSHAWVAAVGRSSGTELDVVMYRVLPPVFIGAVVVGIAIVATRLSGRWVAGPLAALVAVLGGHLDASGTTRVNELVSLLSPSTVVAIVLLLATVLLLAERWRGARGGPSTALLVVLAFTVAGAKGPTAAVLVGGLVGTAALASLGRMAIRRHVLVDTAAVTVAFVVAYVLVLGGDSHGAGIDLRRAAVDASRYLGISESTILGSSLTVTAAIAVLTVVAVLARGAGVALLFGPDDWRRPLPWLLVGTGLAGAGAVVVFAHPGASQFYFLRSAVPLLAVASAWGLVEGADRVRGRRLELSALGVLVGAGAVALGPALLGRASASATDRGTLVLAVVQLVIFVTVLGLAGVVAARRGRLVPGLERRHTAAYVLVVAVLAATVLPSLRAFLDQPLSGPQDAETPVAAPHAFGADQVRAARWLRDASAPDDVVVTNRHCARANQDPCDPRRFFVAAFTERQVLVEGWAYTPRWSTTPDAPDVGETEGRFFRPFWDEERLSLNDDFFTEGGAAAADRLWQAGVRWAFEDRTVDPDAPVVEHADLVHQTEWARVYALRPPSGS